MKTIYKHIVFNPRTHTLQAILDSVEFIWRFSQVYTVDPFTSVAIFEQYLEEGVSVDILVNNPPRK